MERNTYLGTIIFSALDVSVWAGENATKMCNGDWGWGAQQ